MATEVERKFLISGDEWRRHAGPGVKMRQGYIIGSSAASVRVRVGGNRAWLNIKSATIGATRSEFDYEIPLADAERILDELCARPLIEKTRFIVHHAGHSWEVDVFEGDNDGLVVAEIELVSEDERFEKPDWAGAEVSDDPRYYNAALVDHPYSRWGKTQVK